MTSNDSAHEQKAIQEPGEFPRAKGQSHGGTESAWSVQARHTGPAPVQLGGQTFDNRWRNVGFSESRLGVPANKPFSQATQFGLLSYPAAQALRWWFHANAALSYQHLLLETRLVQHQVEYQISERAISAHEHIHAGDRSNVMPDWGRPAASRGPSAEVAA